MMNRAFRLMLLLACTGCASMHQDASTRQRQSAETPLDRAAYDNVELRGWTVLVAPGYRDEPALRDEVLALLDDHLYRINRAVPSPALDRLHDVEIWAELDMHKTRCMCYHVSPDWLLANGYNPDKAGTVEIGNARAFLDWTHAQPWMVLHELAHAYHDQVLGFDNEDVHAAFQAKVDSGDYEEVLHISGAPRRHYALTNDHEYFAEATEAWFGTNDFHPFVRAELIQVDPVGADLMERIWEPPLDPSSSDF
jgi:hypothetical protein